MMAISFNNKLLKTFTALALIFAARCNYLYSDTLDVADDKSPARAENRKANCEENKKASREAKKISNKDRRAKKAEKMAERHLEKIAKSEPASPFEVDDDSFKPVCKIDNVVLKNLKDLNLKPAKLCSDAVFLRRVYLDLTGTIPTRDEAAKFINSKDFKKREKLVDSLIGSDDFVTYWTMKFGDNLRIKAEFPINLWPNAAQAYSRYVSKSLEDNVPYDKFVYNMLTSSGSNFRVGEVNFYRAMQARTPESIAGCVALTFMGMRIEKLPAEKQAEIANFFSRMTYKSTKEWKEEIVFYDPSKRASFSGVLPDGKEVKLGPDGDPREEFAKWLTAKGNPYFSRAAANKIWSWLFGTEIVYPVDDMFAENKPASQELLDALASEFEKLDFDLRKFMRMIVLSRTYQQSPIPQSEPVQTRKNFGVYGVRQLDAEVLIDILCKVTGTSETYSSTTPEPYTMLPNYKTAVSLPDGSITTSFLELFGKSPRDTGLFQEKTLAPSPSQRLHMVNSSHIRNKIERGPALKPIFKLGSGRLLDPLYLTVLSRYPTSEEKNIYAKFKLDEKNGSWSKIIDAPWVLFNSEEFLNRH